MDEYRRTIDELEARACLWWPASVTKKEVSTSIIPMLLKSQDEFLSILNLCKQRPDQVFDILEASRFPPNLFLKHLAVLADFGGEKIQRINAQFESVFPSDAGSSSRGFNYLWSGETFKYQFLALPLNSVLNNAKLKIDGHGLLQASRLDDMTKDVAMVLLHGSSATNPATAEVLAKCEIGVLLGKPKELATYVRQKYIWVS